MRERGESFDEILRVLQERKISFQLNVDSRSLTTFYLGGEIGILIIPDTVNDLKFLSKAFEFLVLGRGSNTLFCFDFLPTPIVKLGRGFKDVTVEGFNIVKVGAGVHLDTLARKLSTDGYSGLEFAVGIPATLGGAVRMNAGAHGGQMADIVERVRFIAQGEECETKPDFFYRGSTLPPEAVITSVTLRLAAGDKSRVLNQVNENLAYRRKTQPLSQPSLGSVFKNPKHDISAGELLESVGLKGFRSGGVMFSDLHANWIVNPEKKGSYEDVKFLISFAKEMAKKLCGIDLELEWRVFEAPKRV